MNSPLPQAPQPVKMSEGLSLGKILVFLFVMIAIAGAGLYIVASRVLASSSFSVNLPEVALPSITIPDNPLGEITSLGDLGSAVQKVVESLENSNVVNTGDAGFEKLGETVLYKQQGQRLTLVVGGGTSYDFVSSPGDSRRWVGAIHDPYKPLVNLAGTPFFSGEGLPIKPAKNIVRITDQNGNFDITSSSFKVFPFFSPEPTTIGIVEGYYDIESMTAKLRFTFIDTRRSVSTQIESDEMAFPKWFKKGGFPPAFATQKYIKLHPKNAWYGENVFATLQKYVDGDYQFEKDAFHTLSLRELSNATMSARELTLLKNLDIHDSTYNEEAMYAVRKLVALVYYSKVSEQTDGVRAILPELHRSIRSAIASNPDLSL